MVRSQWYPKETFTDTDYSDDLALLTNTPDHLDISCVSCIGGTRGVMVIVVGNGDGDTSS